MLDFDTLNHIAKVVTRSTQGLEWDDLYQNIWEKFIRYPPKSKMYAWQTAWSVRNTMWTRRPKGTASVDSPDFPDFEEPHGTNVLNGEDKRRVRLMLKKLPRLVKWLIRYNRQSHHTNAESTMAHRYRKRLRELKD